MIMQSVKIKTKTNTDDVQIIYNLVFQNALYSIECYKEGAKQQDFKDYCLLTDITDDEGEAEVFLKKVSKGEVFPIHIKDMCEDYFKA